MFMIKISTKSEHSPKEWQDSVKELGDTNTHTGRAPSKPQATGNRHCPWTQTKCNYSETHRKKTAHNEDRLKGLWEYQKTNVMSAGSKKQEVFAEKECVAVMGKSLAKRRSPKTQNTQWTPNKAFPKSVSEYSLTNYWKPKVNLKNSLRNMAL